MDWLDVDEDQETYLAFIVKIIQQTTWPLPICNSNQDFHRILSDWIKDGIFTVFCVAVQRALLRTRYQIPLETLFLTENIFWYRWY